MHHRLRLLAKLPRRSRSAWALAAALASAGVAFLPALLNAGPLSIGGLLPIGDETFQNWKPSRAWIYPVGNPRNYQLPDRDEGPGYQLLRCVERDSSGDVRHAGADLGNRRAGGCVRAAASGLVVRAGDDDPEGYGNTLVLAHRLPQGGWVFSVYAHLQDGSMLVHEGDVVSAGQAMARVGRTGRASTNHLHFEIRRPGNPGKRWERARVVDPIEFVAQRLPAAADSSAEACACPPRRAEPSATQRASHTHGHKRGKSAAPSLAQR